MSQKKYYSLQYNLIAHVLRGKDIDQLLFFKRSKRSKCEPSECKPSETVLFSFFLKIITQRIVGCVYCADLWLGFIRWFYRIFGHYNSIYYTILQFGLKLNLPPSLFHVVEEASSWGEECVGCTEHHQTLRVWRLVSGTFRKYKSEAQKRRSGEKQRADNGV